MVSRHQRAQIVERFSSAKSSDESPENPGIAEPNAFSWFAGRATLAWPTNEMVTAPLTVAWFSYFPVEWLSGVPEPVTRLPRQHPASWQRVLLTEFEKNPALRLHVVVLRKQFERNLTFERNGVTFHLIKTPGGLRAPSLFWRFNPRAPARWIENDVAGIAGFFHAALGRTGD